MYKNYLFDLDGTLLPMDMEKFVKLYFSSLCKRCTPVIKIEPDALIKAMWAGTDAMTRTITAVQTVKFSGKQRAKSAVPTLKSLMTFLPIITKTSLSFRKMLQALLLMQRKALIS